MAHTILRNLLSERVVYQQHGERIHNEQNELAIMNTLTSVETNVKRILLLISTRTCLW